MLGLVERLPAGFAEQLREGCLGELLGLQAGQTLIGGARSLSGFDRLGLAALLGGLTRGLLFSRYVLADQWIVQRGHAGTGRCVVVGRGRERNWRDRDRGKNSDERCDDAGVASRGAGSDDGHCSPGTPTLRATRRLKLLVYSRGLAPAVLARERPYRRPARKSRILEQSPRTRAVGQEPGAENLEAGSEGGPVRPRKAHESAGRPTVTQPAEIAGVRRSPAARVPDGYAPGQPTCSDGHTRPRRGIRAPLTRSARSKPGRVDGWTFRRGKRTDRQLRRAGWLRRCGKVSEVTSHVAGSRRRTHP